MVKAGLSFFNFKDMDNNSYEMFQSANFDEDLSLNSSQFVSISTDSSIKDVFIAVPTVEEEDATRSKSP